MSTRTKEFMVRGPPSCTEFELRTAAEPVVDEQAERPQIKPIPVMPFRVRNKGIAQYGYTPECKGCRAARAGIRQQVHDEASRTRKMQELKKTAEGRKRMETDEDMRQNKRTRIEARANDEPMSAGRGEGQSDQGASSRSRGHDHGAARRRSGSGREQQGASSSSSFPMEPGSEEAAAAKIVRSGSVQVEQPELAGHLEKRYRGSSIGSAAAAAEHVETKHGGEDMTAIEDEETDPESEQSQTMFIPLGSAQTDSKEHQSRIIRTVAEKNPNMVVTLPVTPEEGQEAATAVKCAMQVCCEKSSWNKRFAHIWSRWSKTWSMPETSMIMHMEGSRVVDFDMCQFGYQDKGPMRMIANSTQIAKQDLPEPKRTSRIEKPSAKKDS